jgi:hypothetical protein
MLQLFDVPRKSQAQFFYHDFSFEVDCVDSEIVIGEACGDVAGPRSTLLCFKM